MKGIFGVVVLLLVLATVGLVASRQWQAVRPAQAEQGAGAPAGSASAPATMQSPRQRQEQVRSDIDKAMQQGASRIEAEQ